MLGVAVLAFIAGCDSDDPPSDPGTVPTGETTASGGPSTPPSVEGQHIGKAPRVSSPLDVARFGQAPCDLLTDAQLADFGGETGTQDTSAGGEERCRWQFGTQKDSSAISGFYPGPTKSGLSDLYVNSEQGAFREGYFEPTEVVGYPAVFAAGSDHRDSGSCELMVGVRDDTYMHVSTQAPAGKGREGCTAAENLAAAMIKTLGG